VWRKGPGPISQDAAVASGARYPGKFVSVANGGFLTRCCRDLAAIRDARERRMSDLGHRELLRSSRCGSMMAHKFPSQGGVDYFTSDQPGHWRQDPISLIPNSLWRVLGQCTHSCSRRRVIPRASSADMTSAAYTVAYNEAKKLWRRWSDYAHAAHRGADFYRDFLAYDGHQAFARRRGFTIKLR